MNASNETSPIRTIVIPAAMREARAQRLASAARGLGIGFLARRVLGPARAYFRRRRDIAELMAMDDRMLRDMGLSRTTIVYDLDHGRVPANVNLPLHRPDAA